MFASTAFGLRLGCLGGLLLAAQAVAAPPLPNIPTNVFNITNYGAVSSSVLTNTAAIQATINAAATSASKGGTVEVPAGTYLSGPLNLSNSINLQIDPGATLQMLPYGQYPGTADFISANKLTDIELSGAGIIDGQGAAWWTIYNTNNSLVRPHAMFAPTSCTRILIQNTRLQNPPNTHITFNTSTNVTIEGITIATPLPSPNTDGIDVAGTNFLIQNCSISDGDDNIAIGGFTAGVVVTNCSFGVGHGVSIGSFTDHGGVSNLMVINCTFTNTQYGIRLKSDDGRGGVTQNLSYLNLNMANVNAPITIYSYYLEVGTPDNVSPEEAATQTVAAVTSTTPIWRNILFSNLTATVGSGRLAGIIWGRTELPVTNVTLAHVNISASQSFEIYNAQGVQFVDSQIALPAGNSTFALYNAGVVLSNDLAGIPPVTFAGLASSNSLALYNAAASMTDSNALGFNPVILSAGTLTVSNDLALSNPVLNFVLGTNKSRVMVTGNLGLNATLNFTNGGGFGAGAFTVFEYGGDLQGAPVLGAMPSGFSCALNTNTSGQVQLVVQSATPPRPAFTSIQSANGQLVMSGAGGPVNTAYNVLASTNTLLPFSQWTVVATDQFDALGNFSFTNAASSSVQNFFLLRW